MYDGRLAANIDVDFLTKDFTYRGTAQIDKVNIGKLIKESKIVAQPHEGIASFNADFSGHGTNQNTITGNAQAQLVEANLSGLEVLHAMGKLLGLGFLSNFKVTQGNGSFKIQNAIVTTEDTKIVGPDADINVRGQVGFNQSLDLVAKLILSQASAQQTRQQVLDNFFSSENGRFYTEMEIKGTVTQPKPNLSKFIKNKIQKKVKKVIQKEVFKAFESLFKK